MSRATPISETVTLHVPFRLVKRGGRKEIQLPEGTAQPRKPNSALVKALARAFRWKRMLESGEFGTVAELAHHEAISLSYVTRMLQLTRLAPDLIEAILSERQAPILKAKALREPLSDDWADQRRMWERGD